MASAMIGRSLLEDCYRKEVANMLDDKRTFDLVTTVGRGICHRVPATVIPDDIKQRIDKATLDVEAAEFIRGALKTGENPDRMDVFLEALMDTQRHHAEKIMDVYKEYMMAHLEKCNLCEPQNQKLTKKAI